MAGISVLPSPPPFSKQHKSSCLKNKLKPTYEIFAEVKMLAAGITLLFKRWTIQR
jgi:hypothetical protein